MLRGALRCVGRAAVGLEGGAVALVEVVDQLLDPLGVVTVDPGAAGPAAGAGGVDLGAIVIAAALAGELDDAVDAFAGDALAAVAQRGTARHADAQRAVVALRAARDAQAAVAGLAAAALCAAAIRHRAAGREAHAGPAVLAGGAAGAAGADAILPAGSAGSVAPPRLGDARLAAAVLAAVAVLALLAGGALIALTAEHRGEAGDALAVETAETGRTVAGGLALLATAVAAAVGMLALLADWAAVRLAAKYRCDAGDAVPALARQARGAIARGTALLAQIRHADLRGAVAAGRAARHARAAIARRAARRVAAPILTGRDRQRTDQL